MTGFWISRFPITFEQYRMFVESEGYELPIRLRDMKDERRKEFYEKFGDHPVTGISWIDAMNFCQFFGLCLPTAAQWEAALTGHRKGMENVHCILPPKHVHFGEKRRGIDTVPVTAHMKARGPFGTVQQLGNVWEYCLDSWETNDVRWETIKRLSRFNKAEEAFVDPVIYNDSRQRELRGGSWHDLPEGSPYFRGHNQDENCNDFDSFRVIWMDRGSADCMVKAFETRINSAERKGKLRHTWSKETHEPDALYYANVKLRVQLKNSST